MLLLLQLACSQNTYETPERLLDPPEVAYLGVGSESEEIDVTGSRDEWTVIDADATWALRSPAEPDISALDGQAATVSISAYDYDESSTPEVGDAMAFRNLVIATDSSVEYEATANEPSSDYPSQFGTDFVRYGDALGTMAVEYWLLTVRELVFTTDDGEVALGPSEPTILLVGGEQYLTTVLSAWESDILNESVGQPKCGGIGDRFSYEMVHVPSDTEPELPEGLQGTGEIAHSSCG